MAAAHEPLADGPPADVLTLATFQVRRSLPSSARGGPLLLAGLASSSAPHQGARALGAAWPANPLADPGVPSHLPPPPQDSFSAPDLLNSLSDRLIASSSAAPPGAPFDPLPFLRTFTSSLDSLLTIRAQAQTRTERLEADVRKAEKEYSKRLGELDRGFDAVHSGFADLSASLTDLTSPTLRIGDLLATLHASRSKAQATTILLSYYLALAAGDEAPLDKLLRDARRDGRDGREGRMRAAVTGRRLLSLVKDDGRDGAGPDGGGEMAKVRRAVEEFGERFEKDVLGLFDKYYRCVGAVGDLASRIHTGRA